MHLRKHAQSRKHPSHTFSAKQSTINIAWPATLTLNFSPISLRMGTAAVIMMGGRRAAVLRGVHPPSPQRQPHARCQPVQEAVPTPLVVAATAPPPCTIITAATAAATATATAAQGKRGMAMKACTMAMAMMMKTTMTTILTMRCASMLGTWLES